MLVYLKTWPNTESHRKIVLTFSHNYTCRYLKSIFPKAEETLLLDILANADNNVQIASEKLLAMGYEKRDTTAPKLTNRNKEEQVLNERRVAENTPPPVPKIRTNDEKNKSEKQIR